MWSTIFRRVKERLLFVIDFQAVMEQNGTLIAHIPSLDNRVLGLKLRGFDAGGIWVENQHLTDMFLETIGEPGLPAQPVFFVPYSAIRFAVVMAEGQSLSAAKLGL